MFERLAPPAQLEDDVLAIWDERDVFRRSVAASEGRPSFVFFEGPPTANGRPHNGHVLTRVMKDVIPRYQTMRGKHVRRKAGWDTHGLPVEIEVQKRMGLKGREGIVELGVEKFNRACRDSVFVYTKEWEELTRQVGFWADMDDPYVTYHRAYVESVWWALSELFNKGLLYQGKKVVWWWPHAGTALSAAEMGEGYRAIDEAAVTVRFVDAADPTISYLAWTTTPWTLPSNVALAVGENIDYALCDDGQGGTVVVAVALAEGYDLVPRQIIKGSELVGRRYVPMYDFGAPEGGDSMVIVAGHHVTTSAGTGIVHTAPAFGEDDMLIAKTKGLGVLQWIEPNGTFTANTPWAGVFCKDADKAIIRDLKERGVLFKIETYRHDYPFAPRGDDEPLIQYARPAWFIRTTERIDEVIENNQTVNWQPSHIKDGRFGDFLRNNVDWALSRERFWGTPLNVWRCPSCEAMRCPHSTDQLREWGAVGFDQTVDEHLQIHRPWIDGVTLPCACGGTMQRVPEVIDCWFDSGCMPFAQWGFPHQGVEEFRSQFPADFISEAIDQTRGWFYSLIMISTLLFDDETLAKHGLEPVGHPRPYKNCIVLGHVCDREGYKESKSKGNYTSPNLVLRGHTWMFVLPDDSLKPGTVGLKAAQVGSLDLGNKDRITLSLEREADGQVVQARVVKAQVKPKDTVHMHPDDIALLGLDDRVWFRTPGMAPGADAFRWLFCASNPPWSKTRLSMRAVREGQREFLMRLRNVYQFFAIYADIAQDAGTFRPGSMAPRAPAQRSSLDRWILHRLHSLIDVVTLELDRYGIYPAARQILAFVDDLSNWYVRRSRSRFWGEGDDLADALHTLYDVLVVVSKLISPFVPFTAEALYQQLVVGQGVDAPDSVHLTTWPTGDPQLLEPSLDADMALARQVCSLGLAARTSSKVKVRQPLRAITVVLVDPAQQSAVDRVADLIKDELNVHAIRFADDASAYVDYTVKPDFKKLGRRLGKDMKAVAAALRSIPGASAHAQLSAGELRVTLPDGRAVALTPDDCQLQLTAKGAYEAASAADAVVILHTEIDDDLRSEGFVRELTNRVQNLRKQLDLGYTQRIRLAIDGDEQTLDALRTFGDYLTRETLALNLALGPIADGAGAVNDADVDGRALRIAVLPV